MNRLTTICELNVFKILVIEIEKRKNLNWENKLSDGLIYFVKPKQAHNELSKRPVKETTNINIENFSDDWANAHIAKNQTFIQKFKLFIFNHLMCNKKHNISIRITCLKTHEFTISFWFLSSFKM